MDFDLNLAEYFIELSEPRLLAKNRVHAVLVGKQLIIAGVLPYDNGRIIARGTVGANVNLDTAKKAARACVVQALSVIAAEHQGSLNKVKRVLTVNGLVAANASFADHEKVFEDASQLLGDIFGKHGKHVLTASGASSLPQNSPVMLGMTVEMK